MARANETNEKLKMERQNNMNDEKKTRMTADDTLLTPANHALVLIDHQYLQLLAVRSHPSETVVNNTVLLAKTARLFRVPTLLTTAFAERQALFEEVQAVFPEQKPIDRTGLNSWDDQRIRDWVKKTGKRKLVMAGLWTEVCLSMAVLSALAAVTFLPGRRAVGTAAVAGELAGADGASARPAGAVQAE